MEWGDRYKVEDPPVRLFHKACGAEADPHLVCSHCAEPVAYGDLHAEYAPGRMVALSSAARSPTSTRAPGSRPTSRSRTGGSPTSARASRAGARRSTSAGRSLVPGYIEPHTHPWCLYSPTSLLEVAVPDGTTTLVYDNLFFFLVARRRRAARDRRRDERRARRTSSGWRGSRRSRRTRTRRRASPSTSIAPMLAWPEVVASRRDHELDVGRDAASRGSRAGIAAAKAARQARRGPQRRRLLQPPQRALRRRASPPTTRRSPARRRCDRLRLGMWTMLRQSSLRPDLEPMLRDLAPIVGSRRRLMFTTDGAVPSFYAERGVIGGALRIASDLGVDPMRALQMATIDPATFLGLDEELGGDRARPPRDAQRPARARRVAARARATSTARSSRATARCVAAPPTIAWPRRAALVAPPPSRSRR